MENKRKKKRIIIITILSVILALLLSGVLYYIFRPDKGDMVETVEVAKGNVIQTLDKTATVSTKEKGEFSLVDGVVVKKVNVKVGETVKKGQLLATFDVSSLQEIVDEKQETYNTAKATYDRYLASSSSASGKLAAVNSEIAALEAKIAKLEKEIENQKEETLPEDTTTAEKNEIEQLKEAFNNLIDDTVLSSKLIQAILKHSDSAQQVIDALKALINSIGKSAGSIDISGITSAITTPSKEQSELLEAQLELVELKTKKATLTLSADNSFESIYKKVADSAYDAYIAAKETADSVAKGWVAEYDGIVSKIDIKEGQKYTSGKENASQGMDISSLLSAVTSGNLDISSMLSGIATTPTSAMSIEYFPLTATFALGKTEVSKVEVGQKVDIIVNSDETVSGTVVYKSAVASEGSSLDITSMLGGSSTNGGVEVRVELDEYNSNIIIGFDVEISIKTDEVENTVVVPIESIQYENSKAYVYIYNKEEKNIVKTEVKIGLRDDMAYEIVSGCEVGDIIVKSPTSTLKDGQKIQSNLIGKTVG